MTDASVFSAVQTRERDVAQRSSNRVQLVKREVKPERLPLADVMAPEGILLAPGTVHARLGAAEILAGIAQGLRAAWLEIRIRVGSDNGLAVPGVYEYCEMEGLPYGFGYASNAVLHRATAQALADLELFHHW